MAATADDAIHHAHNGKGAVLDDMHVGDIKGALGTIRRGDTAARKTPWARLVTLLAIMGPGLIVMVGDNDAGAYGTYTQAGQNYGTTPCCGPYCCSFPSYTSTKKWCCDSAWSRELVTRA